MAEAMPAAGGSENRQRHQRRSALIAAKLIHGERTIDCDVVDLSAGGARLRCDQGLAEDTRLTLSFPGTRDFAGAIVWSDAGYLGFMFDEPAERAGPAVEHILETLQDERERRKQGRASVLWGAELYAGIRRFKCSVLNFSGAGAKVRLERILPVGTSVTLRSLHFGERYGEVVWSAEGQMGVKFTEKPVVD